jgi:hypothetical protein
MSHMTGIENNKQVLKKVEILISFYLFFSHTAKIYRDTGKDDNVYCSPTCVFVMRE